MPSIRALFLSTIRTTFIGSIPPGSSTVPLSRFSNKLGAGLVSEAAIPAVAHITEAASNITPAATVVTKIDRKQDSTLTIAISNLLTFWEEQAFYQQQGNNSKVSSRPDETQVFL
jgi:hypothetical protein